MSKSSTDGTAQPSLYNMGIDFAESGQLENAVRAFLGAAKENPQDEKALFNLAGCLMRLGRTDDALAVYDRVLQINPKLVQGWVNKANILARGQRLARRFTALTWRLQLSLNQR
jgi:tetratricopeptide (TPR) repeat protein